MWAIYRIYGLKGSKAQKGKNQGRSLDGGGGGHTKQYIIQSKKTHFSTDPLGG